MKLSDLEAEMNAKEERSWFIGHPIMEQLFDLHVTTYLCKIPDSGNFMLMVGGFYEAKTISIYPNDNPTSLDVIDDSGDLHIIGTFDDLVRLNYDWWKHGHKVNPDKWPSPDKEWIPDMLRMKLIEEVKPVILFKPLF